jgi:2-dehydro-3-deoxy-D-gluconate 5-dehydrogenase
VKLSLSGRVAIVTGASRGLGKAAAEALVDEGVHVVAVSRDEVEMERLVAEHPTIRARVCDVRDRRDVERLPREAVEMFGRLDVVVNNAGIAPVGRFRDQNWSLWDEVMAVNVTAAAALARAAAPEFCLRGYGKVVNIASTAGILGKATLAAYSASKGALIQLTKALAAEWAPDGIQVNVIAPGAFRTDAQRAVLDSDDLMQRRTRKIPARRFGEPAEIGPLVCYLASPEADFVTGAVFVIDGGESAKQ